MCAVLRGVGVLGIAWACNLFSCFSLGGLVAGGVKTVLLGGYTRTFSSFHFSGMLSWFMVHVFFEHLVGRSVQSR